MTRRTGHATKPDPELLKGNHVAATRANTDNERGSQRRSVYGCLSFSPGAYPSFVSMFISSLIKDIVNVHSFTCTASEHFLLSVIYNWEKRHGELVRVWPVFLPASGLDLKMM